MLGGPKEALFERSPGIWLGGTTSLSCCCLVINRFYFICLLSSVKYFLVFYYMHVSILGFMKEEEMSNVGFIKIIDYIINRNEYVKSEIDRIKIPKLYFSTPDSGSTAGLLR